MSWQIVRAVVKEGYGVASGINPDPRFPEGSLPLQLPLFKALGLNIQGLHPATLNLCIAPASLKIIKSIRYFSALKWCVDMPEEDFFFCNCLIRTNGETVERFVYYPCPETKAGHFHPSNIIEVLAPWMEGIKYGKELSLMLPSDQIAINRPIQNNR